MLLKSKAEADEEAIGFQRNIVTLVEVEQSETITAEQIEFTELQIGTEHGIKV